MRGIYKITNKINNKVYIGESLDIRRRWKEHLDNLNNNKHHSYKLQNDWNKYGEDNFDFRVISALDDCINSYIDKFISLLYEHKYIKEYDSLNNGYNVEDTLKEILNGNKIIEDEKRDISILKKYTDKIKNKIIKEKGGIIYLNCFSINDIKKDTNLSKEQLKGILYNNNFIILQENEFILNENIFDKMDIICNDKFSNIKINENVYLELIDNINKILKSDNVNFKAPRIFKRKDEIIKKEEIKVIDENKKHKSEKRPLEYQENNTEPVTLLNFISSYTLNINVNDVFKFLRENGVLKFIETGDTKKNYPTDKFKDCFTVEEHLSKNNNRCIKIFITNQGKKIVYDMLIDNNIIA
jgi:group I intron endonuclease